MFKDFDLESADIGQLNIPWYKKFLFRFFPRLFMKLEARKMALDDGTIESAERLFGNDKKIHIQPLSGEDGRGFIIFVDNKISFWFFQDGGHFKYDGFEMGKYDDGNVQVFDGVTNDCARTQ